MAVGAWLSDMGIPRAWQHGTYAALMALSMLVLWAGKRFVTLPRMGRVQFGRRRRTRRNLVRANLFISVLAGMAVWLLTADTQARPFQGLMPSVLFPVVWVVNVLLVFGLGAYFLDFDRRYLIGLMYAVPVPADLLLGRLVGVDLTFIAFALPAIFILLIGTIVFLRFLRDYPNLENADDGNA
jgi:hypothetical protein